MTSSAVTEVLVFFASRSSGCAADVVDSACSGCREGIESSLAAIAEGKPGFTSKAKHERDNVNGIGLDLTPHARC